ncbi:MAG: hypothetical protein HJJLKODD_00507 [Phycisphaerae bacterium]|nr:hypothetical protein [Phycisphaerae bacterium]
MSTAKKKLYLIVVAVGLLALVVDRLMSSAPQNAEATQSSTAENVHAPVAPAKSDKTKSAADNLDQKLFPENMLPVDWSKSLSDPFATPEVVQKMLARKTPAAGPENPTHNVRLPGEPLTISEFQAAHQLRGVMLSDATDVPNSAVVDDQVVVEGRKFDDAVLLRVERDRVYFQCKDGEAVLILQME